MNSHKPEKDANCYEISVEQNETYRLLFLGAPLLDISVHCEEETLKMYGLKRDDCVLAGEEHSPLFHQLFHNPDSRLAAGGSAQNAARVSKWTIGKIGEVTFAGCTGCDDYEKWMRNKLYSEEVLPLYVTIPESGTGVCACLLSAEGDRSMIARQGAAALFSAEHLNMIRSDLDRTHCIFVEGYFLVHSADVVFDLAGNHSPSQIFSLSLSAEFVCRSHCDDLMKLIPKTDILFGNEAEVKAFAQAMGGNEDITVEECAKMIRRLQTSETAQSRVFVVTRGSKPLLVIYGSEEYRSFEIKPVQDVVDSVGCGDALAGAFLANYVISRNVISAINAGMEAARQILRVTGCDPPRKNR